MQEGGRDRGREGGISCRREEGRDNVLRIDGGTCLRVRGGEKRGGGDNELGRRDSVGAREYQERRRKEGNDVG